MQRRRHICLSACYIYYCRAYLYRASLVSSSVTNDCSARWKFHHADQSTRCITHSQPPHTHVLLLAVPRCALTTVIAAVVCIASAIVSVVRFVIAALPVRAISTRVRPFDSIVTTVVHPRPYRVTRLKPDGQSALHTQPLTCAVQCSAVQCSAVVHGRMPMQCCTTPAICRPLN